MLIFKMRIKDIQFSDDYKDAYDVIQEKYFEERPAIKTLYFLKIFGVSLGSCFANGDWYSYLVDTIDDNYSFDDDHKDAISIFDILDVFFFTPADDKT